MITDGPVDGSTPEYIDFVLARGSSTSSDRLRYRPAVALSNTRRPRARLCRRHLPMLAGMVSMRHEAIVELIRLCPAFAAEMLAGVADLVVPEMSRRSLGSPDLSEVVPTERRADAVVTLNQDSRAVLGIVVEVQLGHDSDKRTPGPATSSRCGSDCGARSKCWWCASMTAWRAGSTTDPDRTRIGDHPNRDRTEGSSGDR